MTTLHWLLIVNVVLLIVNLAVLLVRRRRPDPFDDARLAAPLHEIAAAIRERRDGIGRERP